MGRCAIRITLCLLLLWPLFCACERSAEQVLGPRGVAYVLPLGEVPKADVERAVWAMASGTGRPVKVLPAVALPNQATRQNASVLLDRVLHLAPPDTFRIAGVTHVPLRSPEYDSLIGYARQYERGLVYTTAALPSEATEAAHRRRVRRVVQHELGHTFGLTHTTERCVMRDTATGDVDQVQDSFSAESLPQVRAALSETLRHPTFLAHLASERLRLGRWDEAIAAYRAALQHDSSDARLRTALGVALMASGQLLAADEAFVLASRAEPELPQPYYARAVLYAAGRRVNQAPAFLEAAVLRDGNPQRAHRAAGILYQDLLGDPTRATHHFERHLALGGREPEVIARLSYLLAPTTLTFEHPEVIIARWHPKEGLLWASAAR